MLKNKTLLVLALIMVINALGFGIIIPLVYPFSKQFGITPQGISWLIASFSLAQFIATPILGSLSDKYGRKPLLLISLLGTALSFMLFASATSVIMLFAARILDGITGGNISVAQAVIADIAKPEEKAKAYGILGASFGMGFLLGPTIGGLLSHYGIAAPFYFAAGLTLAGVILGYFLLKESNTNHVARTNISQFFNFKKPFKSIRNPATGYFILLSFILAVSQFSMIIGFQAFTVDTLKLSPQRIGLFFTSFAATGILMQIFGIKIIQRIISSKEKILMIALALSSLALAYAFTAHTFLPFFIAILGYGTFNSLRDPMLNALISENTPATEQGSIMGINQSYISIGQIVGPLIAGMISLYSINYIFLASAGFIVIAFILTSWLSASKIRREALLD